MLINYLSFTFSPNQLAVENSILRGSIVLLLYLLISDCQVPTNCKWTRLLKNSWESRHNAVVIHRYQLFIKGLNNFIQTIDMVKQCLCVVVFICTLYCVVYWKIKELRGCLVSFSF